MTLMKRNGNLFNSFPMLFDDFFTKDLFDWRTSNATSGSMPAVNVKETGTADRRERSRQGLSKESHKRSCKKYPTKKPVKPTR